MVAGSFPEDAATVIRAVSPKRDDHRLPDTAEPTLGDERARSYCSAVRGATDVTVPVRGRSSRASGSYTVERGDTLPRIASRFYGDARRWSAIFHANRDQLDRPELIRPGLVLRIPPRADLH